MQIYNLPAGKYTIGDPAYFFSDKDQDDWLRFIESNDFVDDEGMGFLLDVNTIVVVFHTTHGDGKFEDDMGNSYPVDSGLIGIIPFREGTDVPSGHTMIEFDRNFECFNNNGFLHFGDIFIDTQGDDEDDIYFNEDEGSLYDDE